METDKTNAQNPGNTNNQAGMPPWVMHLLTGIGTMGADFFLFIKPLQEKFDAQNNQIKEQENRITELEARLNFFISAKEKKEEVKESLSHHVRQEEKENVEDLFTIRRKPSMTGRYQKLNNVKL